MNVLEKLINGEDTEFQVSGRYVRGSMVLALLSNYALNKEKNICKPDFEDLFIEDIFKLFTSEVEELQREVNSDVKNYERMLDEMADCAALIVGMYVNIADSLKRKKHLN